MHVLITGGAGFIGSRAAVRLHSSGARLTLLDNHSREKLLAAGAPGTAPRAFLPHLARSGVPVWPEGILRPENAAGGISRIDGDVLDSRTLLASLPKIDAVIHCAGQVGIASSLADPLTDLDVNVRGTLALLEALKGRGDRPAFVFFSSNKVYGDAVNRFAADDERGPRRRLLPPWERGITEQFPAADDGLTPYGASKRAAELYVLDGARREGFRAYVLRASCIYGPGQRGAEDQGWVSHVVKRRRAGETLRVFGDGRQTRDLLHVDDLADLLAVLVTGTTPGGIYNAGGGPQTARSLLEIVRHPALKDCPEPKLEFLPERLFDQRCYVTDTEKLRAATGWSPRRDVEIG